VNRFPTREWRPADRAGGPLDDVLDQLRRRHPDLRVERLSPSHPGDDDNVYVVGLAGRDRGVQVHTGPDGQPPYLVEADDRVDTSEPAEVIAAIETGLHYRAAQTALLATVAEAEPLVGQWRRRFDSSASAGVPAHVTVLFPFLDVGRVTDGVLDELRTLIGARRPFPVRFEECRRFPDVLYLAPTPDQPFCSLTEEIAERWPEAPPYEGQFTEVIPHLTVAHGQPPRVYQELEADLAERLPLAATVASVSLFVNDGSRWRRQVEFPMLG
jgi:2'-5' RNA ligase